MDPAGDGLGKGVADALALAVAVAEAVGVEAIEGDALGAVLGLGVGVIVETPVGVAVAAAVTLAVGVGVAAVWVGGLPASDGVNTDEPPLQPAAAAMAAVVAPIQSARAKKLRSVAKRLTIHTYP